MRYSWTDDGLDRIRWADLVPGDVLRALNTRPQIVRHHPDGLTIYARSGVLYLVIGLEEVDDDEWNVISARRMDADEVALFGHRTGGRP